MNRVIIQDSNRYINLTLATKVSAINDSVYIYHNDRVESARLLFTSVNVAAVVAKRLALMMAKPTTYEDVGVITLGKLEAEAQEWINDNSGNSTNG